MIYAFRQPLITVGRVYEDGRLEKNKAYLNLKLNEWEKETCRMLTDTSSDITILKVYSLHDGVTIYNGEKYRLNLTGVSGNITSLRDDECHVQDI